MVKGIALLSKAFPFREFDIDFLWEFFYGIEDQDFESAILGIINNCEDIKNPVPLVQRFALEAKRIRIEKTQKIMDDRCDPPPKEFLDLVEKIGRKLV